MTNDPKLQVTFDPTFDEGMEKGHLILPPESVIWTTISTLETPTIDLDQNPSPVTVLQFIHDMESYRTPSKMVEQLIVQKKLKRVQKQRS